MTILDDIKLEVQRKIKLDPKKEALTDKLMLPLLENISYNKDTKCYLIKMYASLYFDNLELLEYLEAHNISLGIFPEWMAIYLLDNSLTKYFTKESYLNFLTKFRPYFLSFFLSIKDVTQPTRDYYIKRFIYLAIIKASELDTIQKDKRLLGTSVFSKISLDTFSDEAYRSASIYQLSNIIACQEKLPNPKTKIRLNNLIIQTNFATHFHDYDLMFDLFRDEELLSLTPQVEYYFLKAKLHNIDLKRALNIYRGNPDIIDNLGVLRKDIFTNYSDDEIIVLSKEINFYNDSPKLKKTQNSNFKRRVLALLPWT